MEITVLLRATQPGKPDEEVLRLQSASGKDLDDWEKVSRHIRQNSPVKGFEMELRSGGIIMLRAQRSQLRREVVEDMRTFLKAALSQI